MTDHSQQGFATRAIHLGYDPLQEQGALSPPLYLTSTYTQESLEAFDEIRLGERSGYVYGRTRNPTQALLEERLASLEGAEAAVVTASGMAAISATLFSLLQSGDEIVVDQIVYGTAFTLFTQGLARFGVRAVFADFTRPETVAAAIGPKTRAVYFETPANPNLRLVDIQAVSAIARGKGLLTIVDNTFATPVLQRPWRWAPTWCCIRPPSTWAAMATCWPAPWPAARNWSTRCACKGCATTPARRCRPSPPSWCCAA